MNKKGMKKKVISLVLTLGIITMLILSGPVSAVQVQITNFTSTTPNESSTVSFLVQVDIEAGERIPVQNLTLTLTNAAGLSNYNCTFDTAGTTLTTCSGISINVLNALNYSTGTNYGYGYGYDYSNGVTDYSNATFYGGNSGYGYGYTSGYGYSASPYSELAYNITWTTPAVTANTAYSISFSALADDGAGKKRTYQTSSSSTVTVQNVVETVPPSGGGSSSGGTTAAPSTTSTTLPSAASLGAPAGFTDVKNVGESKSTLAVSSTAAINKAIASATGEAKRVLENIKAAIESGVSRGVTITVNLVVYEVSNPTTGEKVYRSVITLSYVAEEDSKLVEIVEIIPKDVANSVADLLFGTQPEILQDDPIVRWSFTDVKKGDSLEASYTVKAKLASITSSTVGAVTPLIPKEVPKEIIEETPETEDDGQKQIIKEDKANPWLWWIIGIIAVIAIISYFVMKKKE